MKRVICSYQCTCGQARIYRPPSFSLFARVVPTLTAGLDKANGSHTDEMPTFVTATPPIVTHVHLSGKFFDQHHAVSHVRHGWYKHLR